MTSFECLKEDIKRYFGPGEYSGRIGVWMVVKKIYKEETLWIIILFRFKRWLDNEFSAPILKPILKKLFALVYIPSAIILGIHIHSQAQIGKGFRLIHPGCIFIGPAKIGEYTNVCQEVTIGTRGWAIYAADDAFDGVPEIGDNVYIGPGAKVFGKIKIGNNVAIGANSVVTKNIPDNAVVTGNPSRIVGYKENSGLMRGSEG